MVSELRKYQIRIPREILGWNGGLTFDVAQKQSNPPHLFGNPCETGMQRVTH